MVDPLLALLSGTGIVLIFVVIFLPQRGIVARLKQGKRSLRKVLIEDALKHLYSCEYNNVNGTIDSIAGKLSISTDDAAKLLANIEKHDLVISHDEELLLTPEGRSYALRIVRVHRLWEKYLADETGVGEKDWHLSAEEIEHLMSPEQADTLAAQIGNPVFDPHGDPIPSTEGEIPSKKGITLDSLIPGEVAQIIHVEDEPDAIYSQLVAEGLYAGMQVRMIESTKERIKFLANGEEVVLAPLFAKNINVAIFKGVPKIEGKFKNLSSLAVGEKGRVLEISSRCRGQQRRRLMDLGVVPGTEIEVEMKSVGGDPIAYRIRGATVALRKKQAERIFLEN